MKTFIKVILKGFVFVTILTVSSAFGLLKGMWEEADRLARLYQFRYGPIQQEAHWIIRLFAFTLQLVVLSVLFQFFWHSVVGFAGL